METSKLKNMVVLKNLPSNLVEEAIVILKSSKKVKKLEKIEKSKTIESPIDQRKDNEYVLKEAELLVSSYISKLEDKENKNLKILRTSKSYKRLKQYAFISSFIIFIQALLLVNV